MKHGILKCTQFKQQNNKIKEIPNWGLGNLQIQTQQMISNILYTGWSKLEFLSSPKETFQLLLCMYYYLKDCSSGGPCQQLKV